MINTLLMLTLFALYTFGAIAAVVIGTCIVERLREHLEGHRQ